MGFHFATLSEEYINLNIALVTARDVIILSNSTKVNFNPSGVFCYLFRKWCITLILQYYFKFFCVFQTGDTTTVTELKIVKILVLNLYYLSFL